MRYAVRWFHSWRYVLSSDGFRRDHQRLNRRIPFVVAVDSEQGEGLTPEQVAHGICAKYAAELMSSNGGYTVEWELTAA